MSDEDRSVHWAKLRPADQLWLVASALEEEGGRRELVRALRTMASQLEEIEWPSGVGSSVM